MCGHRDNSVPEDHIKMQNQIPMHVCVYVTNGKWQTTIQPTISWKLNAKVW